MKAKDTIASMFCGLHIGSALLNQRGSMILGGYEQNRVLGDVGTFDLPEVRGPRGFLLDVVLGVEIGASPFNQPGNISLWHGIHDDPSDSHRSESDGGRTGSRLIDINPSVPYMYLPPGICETAAQYLSVTWDAGLELYTWNTDDQSSRVIGSPAFMGIILADKQAKNITIKVPFQLLNLTLLPPIVDTPTQYFPCTYNNEGYPGYALGRAFLQAAFFGFEFENNLAYIAQAPGPNMEQSIIKTYQPNDASITPNPVGSFASSWASSWTVLESPSSPSSPSTSGRGISRNATAGVAVGSAFGALAIVAAAAIIWRRKKRTQQNVAAKRDTAAAPPLIGPSMDNNGQPLELCPWTEPSEAYGNAPPHEMVGPDRVYEAPCEPSHHELPLGRAL
ncbi:MAG: hypothetical protein LQ343_002024 [Gyalolechia ehrenbergii]|nr:MAG: hypothetical protein LQ343_002024 [Gyalolechia ehrenbergii]